MDDIPLGDSKYDIRITSIAVIPRGEPLFSEKVTHIKLEDESGGEFVTVRQDGGHTDLSKMIAIDPEEWTWIREAISFMVKQCRPGSKSN